MKTKTFEHKGQMINYYNKAKNNPKLSLCVMGLDSKLGYFVSYEYKK